MNIDIDQCLKIKTEKRTRRPDFTLVKGQSRLDIRKYSFFPEDPYMSGNNGQPTNVNDLIKVIKMEIHGWAGHIARFKDNRWTIGVTEWTRREWTRRQGRPKTRWRDSLIRHLGPAWPRIARDRRLWRQSWRGSSLQSERNPGGK